MLERVVRKGRGMMPQATQGAEEDLVVLLSGLAEVTEARCVGA